MLGPPPHTAYHRSFSSPTDTTSCNSLDSCGREKELNDPNVDSSVQTLSEDGSDSESDTIPILKLNYPQHIDTSLIEQLDQMKTDGFIGSNLSSITEWQVELLAKLQQINAPLEMFDWVKNIWKVNPRG
jgi:hypothetical protein